MRARSTISLSSRTPDSMVLWTDEKKMGARYFLLETVVHINAIPGSCYGMSHLSGDVVAVAVVAVAVPYCHLTQTTIHYLSNVILFCQLCYLLS